ncbi:MYCBP-associated protein isoform X1 [Alosa sapidissima]|uniref:MYCBP-associated protein isoform X1 n=2 Tax=Alosa sapidissima TaxID=34773 RepID=UPI001C07FDD1|nr:MYCBP-associated protein isoform X1 [Alosa sapidissima]
MASLGKSTSKVSRKETRPRSPPDRKRVKASEEFNSVSEEQPPSPTLKRDDIQALSIRQEDLDKLRIPQPPKDSNKPPAMTRVLVRKTRPPDQTRKEIAVSVARPLPQNSIPQPLEYTGPGGPRFDSQGMILPHSILGKLEDFKRDMEARGEMDLVSRVPAPQDQLSQLAGEHGGESERTPHPCDHGNFQSHALQHWNDCMSERWRQQDFISRLLQRPVKQLLMNQSNLYRQTQEQRELISKGLPALHSGHGYRVGSEFWNLPQRYGDEISGITATLTQTERGDPPPITHVAQPHTIRQQSGNVAPEVSVSRTWDSSLYLRQRREELKDVLRELDFNQPEIDGLEVIGSGRPFSSVTVKRSALLGGGKEGDEQEAMEDESGEGDHKENKDPLSKYDDVLLDAVLVPALSFCGELALWTGSPSSHKGEVGISACVTFEAVTGESVSSHIELENHGSTAIYYSWQKIPHTHSFAEVRAARTHTQCFYFNTTMGVILPGERQRVLFTFKSARAGILSELWHLNTHPVLLGGAALQVTLRGVALYQDISAPQRHALQMEIQHKEAVSVCVSLVSDLLRGIRTPERPSSPSQLYNTEEDHFLNINPQLHYHYETIEALKSLWKEVTSSVYYDVTDVATEPQEWDLSVATLRQAVLSLPRLDSEVEVEVEDLRREEALSQLNTLLMVLHTLPQPPPPLTPHTIGRQLWRELVDGLESEAVGLRQTLGMPELRTWGESQQDLQDEACTRVKKEEKSEKKGAPSPKEEKKGGNKEKEEKKGTPRSTPVKDKPAEERPGSRKKCREEKPAGKPVKESDRDTPTSGASPEEEVSAERPPEETVDPRVMEKYRRQLHHQVYVQTERMLLSLWDLLEDTPPKLDEDD